jgi:hypothetical protein
VFNTVKKWGGKGLPFESKMLEFALRSELKPTKMSVANADTAVNIRYGHFQTEVSLMVTMIWAKFTNNCNKNVPELIQTFCFTLFISY